MFRKGDIIPIYAAVVSTISLIWNIINYYLDRATRIKVSIFIRQKIDGHKYDIKIINKSRHVVYITGVYMKFRVTIRGTEVLYKDILKTENINIEINPRSQHTIDFVMSRDFYNILKRLKEPMNKVQIVVEDGVGKSYKSNKIKSKTLVSIYEEDSVELDYNKYRITNLDKIK